MSTITNLEGNINYKLLQSQVAQQNILNLTNNIKSYIKSVKDWSVNKSKYKRQPKMPSYKDKYNLLIYTNPQAQIKEGKYLQLKKGLTITIPQSDKYNFNNGFNQVRILPFNNYVEVEIIYKKNCLNFKDSKRYASIDLGVTNLCTIIDSDGNATIYNGRKLKSYNRYINKTVGQLKSKLKEGQKSSKRINHIWEKRKNKINDFTHKVSRKIVNNLKQNNITTLVVGYNRGWKDSIQIGKRNNQTFVGIPYSSITSKLKYKCQLEGIRYLEVTEEYTSKCDSLVLEEIKQHETYKGKRIKRGLFLSSNGKVINADVNGALNILRKSNVCSESDIKQITDRGWLYHPNRIDEII